jgi:hypothetical protein
MSISPLGFLWLLLGMTLVALAGQLAKDRVHARRLRHLARQWGMQYVPDDRLRLAERLSSRLPLVKAQDVCVTDLMYRTTGDRRHYLFTVEFDAPVTRGRKRPRQVVGFDEPAAHGQSEITSVLIAPVDLPLLEQYEHLHSQQTATEPGLEPDPAGPV